MGAAGGDWERARMDSNGKSGRKSKPFYRNADDTLEDVGITLRQLRYWRQQGLFNPELGPKTKFFTEQDTKRLRFLKRLIVDLGLPVATVQQLISSAGAEDDDEYGWLSPSMEVRTFIDTERLRFVFPPDAMAQLVADAMVGAKPWRVEGLLEPALLLALKSAWMRSPNPAVYEAHIRSLHDRVEHIDLVSRFHSDDEEPYFWPKRSSDPDLSEDFVRRLSEDKKMLESKLDAARSRKYWS